MTKPTDRSNTSTATECGGTFRVVTRRKILQGGVAAATLVASPAYLRRTVAAQSGPIKIGLPTVVTGGYAELGSHVIRTAKLVKEMVNKSGGLLGRPIEFEVEDTQGDPAACVRKTQELVERKGCHLITGVVVSSEARAIMPKLKEWNAVFVSHGNGDGRLTTPQFLVPNFFRANVSAPMGARALALYLKDDPAKDYIAVGSDYAWGQSSVKAFGEQIGKLGKKLVDRVMTPVGNKDFATYITKVMQSGAKGCYVALQGDEARAFYSQAAQYGLSKRVPLYTEIVAQSNIKALGKSAVGLVGGSRYAYTQDTAENKVFVEAFTKANPGQLPDWTDGELFQALEIMFAGIKKANSIEPDKLVPALEDIEVTSIKGAVKVRKCDHQGMNPGIVVKVVWKPDGAAPEIVKIYSREVSTPD
ncbi:MAG: ABC transporter substrate-binding protein, partial [Novosphingobium sp.]|nr:ABC transporter substrate-binding protein [Novosphingobium sp.]